MLASVAGSAVGARHKAAKLYDHPKISAAYFFPRRTAPIRPTPYGKGVKLTSATGEQLAGYWSRPNPGAPTLLYLYGNGGTAVEDLRFWSQLTQRAGLNLFMVDYPGYGASGGVPSFGGGVRAAKAALHFLTNQPAADVPGVMVLGRSAGSTFALDAAAESKSPRLLGLVLDSGIADLGQRLDARVPFKQLGLAREEVMRDVKRDFDHEAKVHALKAPLLVIHTEHDQIVPVAHAKKLAGWAGGKLHQLVCFQAGDHNTIHAHNEDAYLALLKDFTAATMRQRLPAP